MFDRILNTAVDGDYVQFYMQTKKRVRIREFWFWSAKQFESVILYGFPRNKENQHYNWNIDFLKKSYKNFHWK